MRARAGSRIRRACRPTPIIPTRTGSNSGVRLLMLISAPSQAARGPAARVKREGDGLELTLNPRHGSSPRSSCRPASPGVQQRSVEAGSRADGADPLKREEWNVKGPRQVRRPERTRVSLFTFQFLTAATCVAQELAPGEYSPSIQVTLASRGSRAMPQKSPHRSET